MQSARRQLGRKPAQVAGDHDNGQMPQIRKTGVNRERIIHQNDPVNAKEEPGVDLNVDGRCHNACYIFLDNSPDKYKKVTNIQKLVNSILVMGIIPFMYLAQERQAMKTFTPILSENGIVCRILNALFC